MIKKIRNFSSILLKAMNISIKILIIKFNPKDSCYENKGSILKLNAYILNPKNKKIRGRKNE